VVEEFKGISLSSVKTAEGRRGIGPTQKSVERLGRAVGTAREDGLLRLHPEKGGAGGKSQTLKKKGRKLLQYKRREGNGKVKKKSLSPPSIFTFSEDEEGASAW